MIEQADESPTCVPPEEALVHPHGCTVGYLVSASTDLCSQCYRPGSVADEDAPRKKKRKTKKRRKKRVSPEPAASAEVRPSRARYVWPALVLIGLFEVWLFGRRGHIEVCVAKDGVHEFGLLEEKRTDANTRQYPTCDKGLNLGILGSYDETLESTMVRACHRANILVGREATLICAVKEDGWQHRVTETHCPPWHDHYYQRMFWFAF